MTDAKALVQELRELAAECGNDDAPQPETLQQVLEKAADMIEAQAAEIDNSRGARLVED